MSRLEEQLRTTFEVVAGEAPVRTDPADAAIRRAGRMRRTRALATAGTAAVVLFAVLGAGAVLSNRPQAGPVAPAVPGVVTPKPSADAPMLTLAVKAGHRLIGANLDIDVPLDLAEGDVIGVRGGWLHLAQKNSDHRLSYFDRKGAVKPVVAAAETLSVSPDGEHIAWTSGTTLTTATISADGAGRLSDKHSTPIPLGVSVATWFGDRLVLTTGRVCCGGDGQRTSNADIKWDTWDPKAGPFVPTWPMVGGAVHGPSSELNALVGVVPDGKAATDGPGCLALLDPATLAVRNKRCDLTLKVDSGFGSLNPSGQRYFDRRGDSAAQIIDVSAVFAADRRSDAVRVIEGATVETPKWSGNVAITMIDGHLYEWGADGVRQRLEADPKLWEFIGPDVELRWIVGDSYVMG